MRLVLVGPPGAGKGTQALVVAGELGVPHVSTGDIFRANVSGGTPLGVKAKTFMDAGELVPDEVTNEMVADRLAQPDAASGFLLDGYPRNPGQAVVLDELLHASGTSLDVVVEMQVDNDEVVQRLLARAEKEGRADDTEDVIRRRLEVYASSTSPLLGYYAERGILASIDGIGDVADVTKRILDALPR